MTHALNAGPGPRSEEEVLVVVCSTPPDDHDMLIPTQVWWNPREPSGTGSLGVEQEGYTLQLAKFDHVMQLAKFDHVGRARPARPRPRQGAPARPALPRPAGPGPARPGQPRQGLWGTLGGPI